MTDESDCPGPFTRSPKKIRFVELSGGAMSALLDGDLSAASRMAGVSLTEYFVTGRARWLWRFRLDQMDAAPAHARWLVPQAVVGDKDRVVGHAGFHGPPDEVGMVEIGYSIAPLPPPGIRPVHADRVASPGGGRNRSHDRAGNDQSRQRGVPGHDLGLRLR